MSELAEKQENNERRDDHLERDFGIVARDFQRGSDRDSQEYDLRRRIAEQSFQQSQELFDRRLRQLDKLDDVETRGRERSEVSHDDRDGLRFRDAALHSTAVGSLEGETATVGDEEQENVPDEEHAPAPELRR